MGYRIYVVLNIFIIIAYLILLLMFGNATLWRELSHKPLDRASASMVMCSLVR